MKRLNIVVPYRAREAHLAELMPALNRYLAGTGVPYQVLVIEQEDDGLPFNKGALNNIGFLLGQDASDYTCFHDVDYLPLEADYGWPDKPVAIVWYGAETRPLRLDDPSLSVTHEIENVYGGVVLAANDHIARANGHSNAYWGWGPEDMDFRIRFEAARIGMGRRKGRFKALDHDHQGYTREGTLTLGAKANQQRFDTLWAKGVPPEDGLSTLKFEILGRRKLDTPWEMVTVRLGHKPPVSG